ncbi:hypothetical protein Tco_0892219 [Tanacetum coccineum]|uniref:Uncharacterized protein n=1 Tax=Tanacetum coccineum TaxID=301880 RepID=A0ABQ5C757_9ASTR
MAEIGCNWARIGPSKSSQSLSIAHKWAVVMIEGRPFWVFNIFIIASTMGFPGPSDGLRLHPTVFFSSGSGLTADSSVLTLTLAFLDFGLDFAQSFPFHAQIELTLTLDDIRIIFQLPQATDNNHKCFVAAPKFLDMVSFFLNDLDFILELRSSSNFKTTDYAELLTTSAPMSPNPDMDEGESSAQRKSGIIRLHTIQLSIVVQKSHDDLEAKQNEENIKEHLMAEEIEKLVEGTENIGNDEVDNSISNSQNDPDTRLEPGSYKKSLEVEKIVVVSQPVNVIEKEDESAEDDYELRRREKGKELALKIKFKGLQASNTSCRPYTIRPRDQDDPHDDAHLEGENSAKRQKTSEHRTYVFGESSSGQVNESEPGPSTSGDEDRYHIDQMQNFLKNDIVWESRKEILPLPFPQKPTLVVQSCQKDPKAPALSLIN